MSSNHLGFPIETVVVFIVMAIEMISIDLYMHRHDALISFKNAIRWSVFWALLAIVFAIFLYIHHNAEMASLFLTGYALEEALSVDNLFVIMAIFSWFRVPNKYRHRVLYWGVIGAIVFRGIFVAIGTNLLRLGPYVEIIFAIIVCWTAIMMLWSGERNNEMKNYSNHIACRIVKRFYPIWPKIGCHRFFLTKKEVYMKLQKPENQDIDLIQIRQSKFYVTPLLLCLTVVELSDLIFAFDSVPTIIAISREPLIIYSAMMFAILGLRTLYFVLEALKQRLIYLKKSVIILLFFIVFKLSLNATDQLWHHGYKINVIVNLIVVLSILTLGIIASAIYPGKKT